MVDSLFIGFIAICMFVAGFELGWKAGRPFERRKEKDED